MRRTSQLKRLVSVAVVAAALAACGKSSSTTDPVDPGGFLGKYVLKTINGAAPPAVYYITASQTVVLDSATIRVNANNTYSDIRTTTVTDIHGVNTADVARTGPYTTSGNEITFSYTNDLGIPATETLTLSGRTLTVTEGPPDQRKTLTFVK